VRQLQISRVTALVRVGGDGRSAAEGRGLYDVRLLEAENIKDLFENYLLERVEVCSCLFYACAGF
jgi:hypothetical protein